MLHLDPLILISLGLFAVTAVLLLAATRAGQTRLGRVLALAAMTTVLGANTAMVQSYQGEPPLLFERPGPIERQAIKRRGHFEYADKEDGSSDEGGGSSGSGQAQGGKGGADESGQSVASAATSALSRLASRTRDEISAGDVLRDCADCPDMIVVQPGFFHMGAAPRDQDAQPSELPRRTVKVPRWFAIGRTEVTTAQYAAFAAATGRSMPSCAAAGQAIDDPRQPAACVSWRDALAYVQWLGSTTGRTYRLPSEVEWEWAARGGSVERYISGVTPIGRSVNGFGLTNVHGGVAEMVGQCWTDNLRGLHADSTRRGNAGDCRQRVVRDAASAEPAVLARLSARRAIGIDERRALVGFRVVREL